jgi:3-hydroxy-D-aspartate aldolase
VCDDPEIAAQLNEAAMAGSKRLQILVDIDPGMGRTGIRPGDDAFALVRQIANSNSLEFAGLQCYAGHVQHMESSGERREKSLAALDELAKFRDTLASRGLAPKILSGGGTGTFDIDPDAHVLNELQVGSYIFMDKQYNDVWTGTAPPFETSLFVQTTVISAHRDGLATTDAGLKAFATDAGSPAIARGAPENANYFFYGDEQGGIIYPPGGRQLRPKDVVSCVVPHCDPTVNLYDCYHAVRGETLEFIWPIEARGRSA